MLTGDFQNVKMTFSTCLKMTFRKKNDSGKKLWRRTACMPRCAIYMCNINVAFHPVFEHRHSNTLQHSATYCNKLQRAVCLSSNFRERHSNPQQHAAIHCNTLQHPATSCLPGVFEQRHSNTQHHTATYYNILQNTATHCNTLQHTATHCNTLQQAVCLSSSFWATWQLFCLSDPAQYTPPSATPMLQCVAVCVAVCCSMCRSVMILYHSILPPMTRLCCSVLQCVLKCFAVCVAVWWYCTIYSNLVPHLYCSVINDDK